MEYTPKPFDTDSVVLPPELLALTELLAKNTHEVWARGRLADGWRYGEKRDDSRKLHPGLVAYEQLSEVEKAFDRSTALEALKLIVRLGYTILPPKQERG